MYDYAITHSYTCTHTHTLRPVTRCYLHWERHLQHWFPLCYKAQCPRKIGENPSCDHVQSSRFNLLWTICFHDVKQAFREAADAPSDHSHRSWKRRGRWKRWWVGGWGDVVLGSRDMEWNMLKGLTQVSWVSLTTDTLAHFCQSHPQHVKGKWKRTMEEVEHQREPESVLRSCNEKSVKTRKSK